MIEFVLIFLFIVIVVVIIIANITATDHSVDQSAYHSVGVNEPIKIKKRLKVTFADTRQERIFSKKTGKIKYDRIGKT